MKTLCFDFDGVINSYKSGWCGYDNIPDPPVPRIRDLIKSLRDEGYKIYVQSSRCSTKEGLGAVREYLRRYNIEVDEVGSIKPPAIAYIDDRGINFDGDVLKLYKAIHSFSSWTEKEKNND